MTYFKNNYGDVYSDEDAKTYIKDDVFSEDDFEEYLNYTENKFEICGNYYDAGETLRNAFPSDFDSEYDNKIEEITDGFLENLEGAQIGEEVEVYDDHYVTVCDEDGNSDLRPEKTLLLPAEFCTVTEGENKVLRFKTEDEETRFVIDLPYSVAQAIAKSVINQL